MNNIFIVDEDPDAIEYLKRGCILAEINNVLFFNYTMEVVGALSVGDQVSLPSLVITDSNVPSASGYELIKFIKSRFPSVQTAMISDRISPQEKERQQMSGVDAVFDKPSSTGEYQALCISIKRLADQKKDNQQQRLKQPARRRA